MAKYAKGIAGADTERRTDYQEFELGTVERGNGNSVMAYGKAAEDVLAGECAIDLATGTISSGVGYTADVAFKAGEYGWVHKADL